MPKLVLLTVNTQASKRDLDDRVIGIECKILNINRGITMRKRIAVVVLAVGMCGGLATGLTMEAMSAPQDDKMQSHDKMKDEKMKDEKMKDEKMKDGRMTGDKMAKKSGKKKKDKMAGEKMKDEKMRKDKMEDKQ